jgi:hypothetical protein
VRYGHPRRVRRLPLALLAAGQHDVNVRSEGERIIVRDGRRDHVVEP